MSVKTEGRLNDMCTLGEGLLERGIEEGIEQGIEKGRLEERTEGLRSMVETVKSLVGDDFKKVCEIIKKNILYENVSEEEIKKFWK